MGDGARPQYLAYDFAWHLGHDAMVTSELGTPNMFENGFDPELLVGGKYGHQLHFWDLRARRHVQSIDLGANHQMALEIRPAHDPTREYGFLGVVVDTTNLGLDRFDARGRSRLTPDSVALPFPTRAGD